MDRDLQAAIRRPSGSGVEQWRVSATPRSEPLLGTGDWNVAPGVVAALLVLAIYGGLAVSVDVPRAAFGFQSDEATYYMMGHSLASDFDLTYRRADLERVFREFPGGPSGIFLKRGTDLDLTRGSGLVPLDLQTRPDPDPTRLYFGKSFAYPLFAAPLVWILGTNGFLLLHAVLLALMTLAAYLFVHARAPAVVAVALAAGYVFGSVAPVYFVWLTPELFNLGLVMLGYFCWLFKEVARPARLPRGLSWLLSSRSDVVAVLLLGIATFSKPSNVLLVGPPLLWLARRRGWRRAAGIAILFGLVVAGWFAANIAITGEWNFQGGDRVTCINAFPFQPPGYDLSICQGRATDRVFTEIIFDWRVFWKVLGANLVYFFLGRHSGLVPYFFPAVFAIAAFLFARRRREPWQWLVFGAGVAEILLLVIWIPYNYFGGAGVVGNRYFMNTYGVFLFLLPPIGSWGAALVPWLAGALFTAHVTLNPFASSFWPANYAKHGPVRLLPVELTLVNDLPVNTQHDRVRQLFGSRERFQIYFLDDNVYGRDGNSFWVKGHSTADVLVKIAKPIRHLSLTIHAVERDRVVIRGPGLWRRHTLDMSAGETRTVLIPLGDGFPYQGTRVWYFSIGNRFGFVPFFRDPKSTDSRYLGVLVTPEVVP